MEENARDKMLLSDKFEFYDLLEIVKKGS